MHMHSVSAFGFCRTCTPEPRALDASTREVKSATGAASRVQSVTAVLISNGQLVLHRIWPKLHGCSTSRAWVSDLEAAAADSEHGRVFQAGRLASFHSGGYTEYYSVLDGNSD